MQQLDPGAVRLQIENIRLVHPEIVEDNEAWLATLESETDFNEILTTIVRRIERSSVDFDLSPARIADLRQHRVGDKILNAMKAATGDVWWSWLSLPNDVIGVGDAIFRQSSGLSTQWPAELAAIAALLIVSGVILERRVRGVEVVA